MSGLRPSARATDPEGRSWEIYAYKVKRSKRNGRRRLVHVCDDIRAAFAALRSDALFVEAVCWQPPQRYTWTTTDEHRGHVLAQIEGGLSRGGVPRPRHATYVGWRRSAR